MKIFRIIAGGIIVAAGVITLTVGAAKISEEKEFVSQKPYRGVISVWEIDSFEGGSGSRKNFLLSAARGFEKENDGVLVMVVEHTSESATAAMKEGVYPDAISYGNGTDIVGAKKISAPYFPGGEIGGNMYAVPWCRGGYCIISNTSEGTRTNENSPELSSGKIIVSQAEYTVPLAALCLGYEQNFNGIDLKILKPAEAYAEFTEGKIKYLLGTQRDIVRLKNRGSGFKIYPLKGYNDLYQYISLTSVSAEKSVYAEKFINYILSEKVQQSLYKIDMMSAYYRVKNENADINLLQNTDCERTVSAFTSAEELRNLQKAAKDAVNGKDEGFINLRKLLS